MEPMRSATAGLVIPVRRVVRGLALSVALGLTLVAGSTAQVPPGTVNRTELLGDLKALSADDMQGRRIGTPGGEKARRYVIDRFQASGIAPLAGGYSRPFTTNATTAGANVVGRIEGTLRRDRYIVVSAHYDHVGVRNGRVFNGADDNASGTAALFAFGAYFTAHPPVNSLLFVAFDGEEQGLLGSRAFIAAPPVPRTTLIVNLNVDMIGRDPNNELWVTGLKRQPFFTPIIDRVAARASVKLLAGHEDSSVRGNDWTQDSDQFAFIEAGIPGFYFGVEDAQHHHQPTDDYETMTYPFYVRAVETLIDVITEVDANLDAIANRR